jgi:hypothetical protein
MRFDEPHRLPEEFLLPAWAHQDMQGTKGYHVQDAFINTDDYIIQVL